ncbi:MAG: glycoside hydrolase family 32 protein [Lachnospiraceae bacterium]|nr:glycoside hydrolase family 32 protein [Lachnospiraceae bacterium]
MTYSTDLRVPYLGLPVKTGQKKTTLEIFADNEKIQELEIADLQEEFCDYYCWLQLPECIGKTLTLKGELSPAFFALVQQAEHYDYEPLTRPLLHFTAERGWLNDPNGLVYHDGVYHLYFQYNPADSEWGNMSWGHAESTDLLHFRQRDTVLLPDEKGAAFSGSGLVNERGLLGLPKDALIFYYTAAAKSAFTQRIAVSTDGGRTLNKLPREAVGVIRPDSRDPQVFWHEASGAYVMALWVEGEEMAILRSGDLQNWELTDRFTLPGAFECPNLFCLPVPVPNGNDTAFIDRNSAAKLPETAEGQETADPAGTIEKMDKTEPSKNTDEEQWILIAADGSYYFGDFDGYRFLSDGVRRKAYLTELPYAAQIYNGIPDRRVLIPWLRTRNEGKLYTGAMGLPRELGLTQKNGELKLQLLPVREYEEAKKKVASFATGNDRISFEIKEEAVTELVLQPETEGKFKVDFFGQTLTVEENRMLFGRETPSYKCLPEPFTRLHILIDRQIIEVYGNDSTMTAYYETGSDTLTGRITITGFTGKLEVFQWK